MVSYQRLGIVLSLLALTAVGISGCATNGSQQPVGGPTPPTNQTATNSTNPTQTNSKQNAATTKIRLIVLNRHQVHQLLLPLKTRP